MIGSSFLNRKSFEVFSSLRLAFPMLIAALTGLLTGGMVVIFIRLIEISQFVFFDTLAEILTSFNPYALIAIPVLGGLLVGLIIHFISNESKGSGLVDILKAVSFRHGKMSPWLILFKPIASAISIGSGFSLGREAPAAQIGAALGSAIGRICKLSEIRLRNLIACGVSASIAAAFNAPITGMIFALEVIIRDFGAKTLSTVVIAGVAGSIISRIFLGESPAFVIPSYELNHPYEIILVVILGIISAVVAALFVMMVDRTETVFDAWKSPEWLKPVIGGFIVGCIGLFLPQIFGMGFNTIEINFQESLDFKLLLILIVFKMVASSVSIGCGASGGIFAPALFVGSSLGSLFGRFAALTLPFAISHPGVYAIVGMTSVFSGTFHAPVTAIFLVFEMTGDYKIILPIMISSVIATSISQLITKESMETIKFKRSGIDIGSMEEVKLLGALHVEDAATKDFEIIQANLSVKEVVKRMKENKKSTFFVTDAKKALLGWIKPEELQVLLLEENLEAIVAGDVASIVEDYCFLDEPLYEAAKLILEHDLKLLPVMDPVYPEKVVGVLHVENIFRIYTHLTSQRMDIIHRMETESHDVSGMLTMHFTISHRSPLEGRKVKELKVPDKVVLTSIRRGRALIIPEGDTLLHVRDRVFVAFIPESEAAFREWLKKWN